MKVLYLSNIALLSPEGSGVIKKVYAQCKVLQLHHHEVYLACCKDGNTFVILKEDQEVFSISIGAYRGPSKDKVIFRAVMSWVIENEVKVIYSRYETYSLQTARFYARLKSKGVHILLEIPTYPISQRWTMIMTSIKAHNYGIALKQLFNSTIGSLGIIMMRCGVERIVNNNGFDQIWGVPTIKITNGVEVDSIPIHTKENNLTKEIRLVAVASVAKWHGYDRVIKGMAEYYQSSSTDYVIKFDIVGPGSEIENLKHMANNLSLSKHVTFWGYRTGEELSNIINNADIAVSVLGAHRNNMSIYDSLKSREYSARCIPFITETTEYTYINKPFVLTCPSDESVVDMHKVVSFYQGVNRMEIQSIMRDFAYSNCDWKVAFRPVCEFIDTCVF